MKIVGYVTCFLVAGYSNALLIFAATQASELLKHFVPWIAAMASGGLFILGDSLLRQRHRLSSMTGIRTLYLTASIGIPLTLLHLLGPIEYSHTEVSYTNIRSVGSSNSSPIDSTSDQ